jgi:hypothetical protein
VDERSPKNLVILSAAKDPLLGTWFPHNFVILRSAATKNPLLFSPQLLSF